MNIGAILPQLQRAQELHNAGRAADAWRILVPLRGAIDNHGQALRLHALVADRLGRTDDAISALKRIAALEGDPAEILGAIADIYGKAGRHGEAYGQWTILVQRYPEIVEAHLNRAVTASLAGRYEAAVEAAEAGLNRFPAEPRLLATKGMALKNAGRILESIAAFDDAVAVDPDRALTRHNQGVALRAACRFDEACHAYAEAERLGIRSASLYANWAAAALEANRVDEAEELYVRSLEVDPDLLEARRGLTRLKIEYRGGQGAFDHYERWAVQRSREPKAWFDWAMALVANRQIAEAKIVAERGLSANPEARELRAVSAFTEGMIGDPARGLAELDQLLAGQPTDSPLQILVTQIAFRAGQPERAAKLLELRTVRDPSDQLAWSMLSLAWRVMGDPREHWLCDYDRLVMVTDVPAPDGRADARTYADEVAGVLDPLHMTTSAPGDQSLRGGTQTSGALFARPDPAIQRFRQAVKIAAEKAVAALPDDPAHPFLRRKSTNFGFSGSWSVRLAAGGHHVSHMHSEGWMSSAYYARVPVAQDASRQAHEGWIQFGVPPDHFGLGELTPRRVIEPQPGRLVLFPSYLWHGTIPFHSGDRLTAAFDYQPL